MALKAPFRKCSSCEAKLPPADGHNLCLLCLGQEHIIETCRHCKKFTKVTRKQRALKLKTALWQETLSAAGPSIPRATTSKKPSTSMRSGPEEVPQKKKKSHRHGGLKETKMMKKTTSPPKPTTPLKMASATEIVKSPALSKHSASTRRDPSTPRVTQVSPTKEAVASISEGEILDSPVKSVQSTKNRERSPAASHRRSRSRSEASDRQSLRSRDDLAHRGRDHREYRYRPRYREERRSLSKYRDNSSDLGESPRRRRRRAKRLHSADESDIDSPQHWDSVDTKRPRRRSPRLEAECTRHRDSPVDTEHSRRKSPTLDSEHHRHRSPPPKAKHRGVRSPSPEANRRRQPDRLRCQSLSIDSGHRRSHSPDIDRRQRRSPLDIERRRRSPLPDSNCHHRRNPSPTIERRHSSSPHVDRHRRCSSSPPGGRSSTPDSDRHRCRHRSSMPDVDRHRDRSRSRSPPEIERRKRRNSTDTASPQARRERTTHNSPRKAQYKKKHLEKPSKHRIQESSSDLPYSDSDSMISGLPDSSPDLQVESKAAVSPSEDLGTFADHVLRMTASLGIEIVIESPDDDDPVYSLMQATQTSPALVPYLPALLKVVKNSWNAPAAIPPTGKQLESLYRVRKEDTQFLFTHPAPNSIIVESAQSTTSKQHTTPVDQEGKKLDACARRVYSSSALGLRVSSYQAIMARYQHFLTEKLGSLCEELSEEKRELAGVLEAEALSMATLQMSNARHQTDCHARSLISSVALHRHAWLRSTLLNNDARARIENLPFDGEGLFNIKTDDSLDAAQKAKD